MAKVTLAQGEKAEKAKAPDQLFEVTFTVPAFTATTKISLTDLYAASFDDPPKYPVSDEQMAALIAEDIEQEIGTNATAGLYWADEYYGELTKALVIEIDVVSVEQEA